MQDLASEFSKNFPGMIPPDHHSRRARGVETQTLDPLNFSAMVDSTLLLCPFGGTYCQIFNSRHRTFKAAASGVARICCEEG